MNQVLVVEGKKSQQLGRILGERLCFMPDFVHNRKHIVADESYGLGVSRQFLQRVKSLKLSFLWVVLSSIDWVFLVLERCDKFSVLII